MGIFFQSRPEVLAPEIRPQGIDKKKFRICRLPKQVIAYPLLSGSAYDKVRVRDAGGGQITVKILYANGFEASGIISIFFGHPFGGLKDIPLPAVAQEHDKRQKRFLAGGWSGQSLCLFYSFHKIVIKP